MSLKVKLSANATKPYRIYDDNFSIATCQDIRLSKTNRKRQILTGITVKVPEGFYIEFEPYCFGENVELSFYHFDTDDYKKPFNIKGTAFYTGWDDKEIIIEKGTVISLMKIVKPISDIEVVDRF